MTSTVLKLREKAQQIQYRFAKDLAAALGAYNAIVFVGNRKLGFLIFALTFLHPNIALGGVIGVLGALSFLWLLRLDHTHPVSGTYLSNSLLVGLFVGYLFQLDLLVIALILISSSLTLLLTFFLEAVLMPLALPVLSFPFTLVAAALALSARRFSNVSDATYYFVENSLPWLQGVPYFVLEGLRSIGSIFCMPDPFFGASMLLGIAVFSPLVTLFLIVGFLIGFGVETSLTLGPEVQTFKHYYFNYSLIFAAVAGVFLVPSRRSLLLALSGTLIGVLIAASCSTFWYNFHVPIIAFPFNVMVFLLVRTIRSLNPAFINTGSFDTPEGALEATRLGWLRHRFGEIGIFCPFDGEWTVQQGFDGEWSHRSHWKHALDFVITGHDGKTFRTDGIELEDYHAFDKPVLSPVEGYVVALQSALPDNRIGKVDNQNNWGNYVILRSHAGVHVTLAHLKKDSAKVKVGDYVTVGKELGRCGNSGYSQEPHLHVQCQLAPGIGNYTLPFHLLNYSISDHVTFHGVPKKREKIAPLPMNQAVDNVLGFRINQTMKWKQVTSDGREIPFQIDVRLDELSGYLYWTDGQSRLSTGKSGVQFYFYSLKGNHRSPLWDLFASAPRIPMTYGRPYTYQDDLPLILTEGRLARFVHLLIQIFSERYRPSRARYTMKPAELEISGRLSGEETFFKLDPMTGIREFRVGERRYVRVD